MKLLVGSIFVDDSPEQEAWLDLQLKFLQATTPKFEHVSVLWKRHTENFLKKTNLIEPQRHYTQSEAHLRGLTYLLYYFGERQSEFDCFLVLDSDAFPIKKDWLPELHTAMSPSVVADGSGAILMEKKREWEIAAVVRPENLENRLHASVLFIKDKKDLPKITFVNDKVMGLAGSVEQDVCIPHYQFVARELAYPLVRSNRSNIHPVACGIYYNMFYHHCCGSGRDFQLRSDSYWNMKLNTNQYTRQLFADPSGFVGKLAGWTPDQYPQWQETTNDDVSLSVS